MKLTLNALLLSLIAGLAAADTVHTTDGRRLEGKVKDLGDEIQLEGKYGSTRLRKAQVSKIEYGKTTAEIYAEKAALLKADDARGHWALAQWCKEQGLSGEFRLEAQAAIAADTDYEPARLALGHQKIDGQWRTPDQIREGNGEVKRNGTWMTADEADRLDQEDLARKLVREAGARNPEVAAAALENLLKIRQDSLLAPCSRVVTDSNRAVRLAAWKGIGRTFDWTRRSLGYVRDLQARFDKMGELTGLALREKDDEVRAAAVAATREFGDQYAHMWYAKRVVEEDGEPKIRAANVLGEMGSAEAVPYLMAAFYTVYIEIRVTNAQQVQDISNSFIDFIADPERRVITQPLRIETPKLSVQRAKTTVAVPEGFHRTAGGAFGAALARLTGEKYSDDFESWNKWYQTNGKSWVKEKVAAERDAKAGK
ncbi:MAG: hypothetical protein HUU15_18760 [Candidatus Brocadiae bacterium]|nr:hypothetical protein [Candidatus Brocadiia bacterium]